MPDSFTRATENERAMSPSWGTKVALKSPYPQQDLRKLKDHNSPYGSIGTIEKIPSSQYDTQPRWHHPIDKVMDVDRSSTLNFSNRNSITNPAYQPLSPRQNA